jgi:hypothetical protein
MVWTTWWDDLLLSNASSGLTDEAAGAIEISARMVAPEIWAPGVLKRPAGTK